MSSREVISTHMRVSLPNNISRYWPRTGPVLCRIVLWDCFWGTASYYDVVQELGPPCQFHDAIRPDNDPLQWSIVSRMSVAVQSGLCPLSHIMTRRDSNIYRKLSPVYSVIHKSLATKKCEKTFLLILKTLKNMTTFRRSQININFPWSLFLSIIETTTKCAKIKWNHVPQASGFTTNFWRHFYVQWE